METAAAVINPMEVQRAKAMEILLQYWGGDQQSAGFTRLRGSVLRATKLKQLTDLEKAIAEDRREFVIAVLYTAGLHDHWPGGQGSEEFRQRCEAARVAQTAVELNRLIKDLARYEQMRDRRRRVTLHPWRCHMLELPFALTIVSAIGYAFAQLIRQIVNS